MQYSSNSSFTLLIIHLLLFIESAYATPAFHTLGGADELLPFSSGVGGDGPSLTYSNPAGLTRVRTHFQVGIVTLYQDFSLSFGSKKEENLVSDRIYQARQLMGSNLNNADVLDIRPLPSNQVPNPTLDQSTQFLKRKKCFSANQTIKPKKLSETATGLSSQVQKLNQSFTQMKY